MHGGVIHEAGTTRWENAMNTEHNKQHTFKFETDSPAVKERFASALNMAGEFDLAAEIKGKPWQQYTLGEKGSAVLDRAVTFRTVVYTGLGVGVAYGTYRVGRWAVNKFFPQAEELNPTAHVIPIDSGEDNGRNLQGIR